MAREEYIPEVLWSEKSNRQDIVLSVKYTRKDRHTTFKINSWVFTG